MVSVGSLVLVCYFTNWAQYRSGGDGSGKFTPDNIDPNLCTHINYAFANLANGVLTQFEWNDDTNYAKVIALKNQNPSLKILLSVGGQLRFNFMMFKLFHWKI
jgi:GH18 family chitinase